MKNIGIAVGILFFVFFSTTSFASEPSRTLDTTSVSDNVSAFASDIIITCDKGKDITFNAVKMVRNENECLLKGNVEIKYNNLTFYTEKAAIHTSDETMLIKMKSCEMIIS